MPSRPATERPATMALRIRSRVSVIKVGRQAVVPFRQTTMAAEDFSFLVQPGLGVKGYYFAVGGANPAWIEAARNGGPPIASHHSPLFKIDAGPSVRLGTEAMTVAVLELLPARR